MQTDSRGGCGGVVMCCWSLSGLTPHFVSLWWVCCPTGLSVMAASSYLAAPPPPPLSIHLPLASSCIFNVCILLSVSQRKKQNGDLSWENTLISCTHNEWASVCVKEIEVPVWYALCVYYDWVYVCVMYVFACVSMFLSDLLLVCLHK